MAETPQEAAEGRSSDPTPDGEDAAASSAPAEGDPALGDALSPDAASNPIDQAEIDALLRDAAADVQASDDQDPADSSDDIDAPGEASVAAAQPPAGEDAIEQMLADEAATTRGRSGRPAVDRRLRRCGDRSG